jgi:hypothetical protein
VAILGLEVVLGSAAIITIAPYTEGDLMVVLVREEVPINFDIVVLNKEEAIIPPEN